MKPWNDEVLKQQAYDLGYTVGEKDYTQHVRGYDVSIRKHGSGHLCGYVNANIPDAEDWVSCHGGITFNDGEWIGFDCAHYGDLIPQTWEIFEPKGMNVESEIYRDVVYVHAEINNIIDQIQVLL